MGDKLLGIRIAYEEPSDFYLPVSWQRDNCYIVYFHRGREIPFQNYWRNQGVLDADDDIDDDETYEEED